MRASASESGPGTDLCKKDPAKFRDLSQNISVLADGPCIGCPGHSLSSSRAGIFKHAGMILQDSVVECGPQNPKRGHVTNVTSSPFH